MSAGAATTADATVNAANKTQIFKRKMEPDTLDINI